MKKLMFAIGAVALCGAVFAEEEAAKPELYTSNIVGFNTVKNKSGAQYQINGSMFVSCSDNSTYNLYDFSISGHGDNATKAKRNYIQFIKPGSLVMNTERCYYYRNGKWLYKNTVSGVCVAGEEVSDFPLSKNEAFLTVLDSRDGCQLNFKGQVQEGVDGVISTKAPEGVQYFFVVNPTDRELALNEVTISGHGDNATKAKRNYIQFIKPGSLVFDSAKTYYYRNGKWLYKNTVTGVCVAGEEVTDAAPIAPGEGVLVVLDSRDGCQINFPSPLK